MGEDKDREERAQPMGGRDRTDDPKRPSQAEGDRSTVEEALGEGQAGQGRGTSAGGRERAADPQRPSQAEGDRSTVEESLREKSR